ncbi:hypothetical protein DPEC_G00210790 [Dallia pectoralis]|uniref:Uncharacterized protein n=1 Tax=Dallia pectoralis TaxID=75939 RepID=A0ACC2G612_DALPE|nr:hypothetical protein DPEC_G00210790 [Dallia pectoralis]
MLNFLIGELKFKVRRLAFQIAVYYKWSYPETWNECSLAGRDWFMGFMKRQPSLSIRCPQATSLTRNTSFNRHNVSLFYDNLANVLDKNKFEGKDIWNMDETGVTTVQEPENYVAGRQTGTLSTTGHSNNYVMAVVLPTHTTLRHWIQPGVALIYALDS